MRQISTPLHWCRTRIEIESFTHKRIGNSSAASTNCFLTPHTPTTDWTAVNGANSRVFSRAGLVWSGVEPIRDQFEGKPGENEIETRQFVPRWQNRDQLSMFSQPGSRSLPDSACHIEIPTDRQAAAAAEIPKLKRKVKPTLGLWRAQIALVLN